MTLLLGALTADAVVLAADGIEFRHSPGAPKREDLLNRRKLLCLSDRRIAIGIHGQNRLAAVGGGLESQRLVVEMLPTILSQVGPTETVAQLCASLYERLSPDVFHTFKTLAAAGIVAAPMGILVVGFDSKPGRPKCHEAWWPLPNQAETSRIIEHPQDKRLPAVTHSGEGTEYARMAISHGGRYSVDRLKRATVGETQEYIRSLFSKAELLQPQGSRVFGGTYHEITVTAAGATWTKGSEVT